ncbi:hypothetical protein [Delftia acidovorans]
MTFRWLMACSSRTVQVVIAANVRSPNILSLATAAGYVTGMQIECVINAAVDVATLSITTLPDDVLHIINNGRIGGVLGAGGGSQLVGGVGGTGLYTRNRILVTNNGTIFGGGGGGGGGGNASWVYSTGDQGSASGGLGGNGEGFSTSGTVTLSARGNGTAGTTSGYAGAVFPGDTAPWATGGGGGQGGTMGVAGATGSPGTRGGTQSGGGAGAGASGGLAGYYVDGNSYVTWLVAGTRLGRVI